MQEVIERILKGDQNAFRTIVQQYSNELLGFAVRVLGDSDDAQDATQATFIKLFRNLGRYNPEYPFRPWLFKIHLNTCRSMYRQRKNRGWIVSEVVQQSDESAHRRVTEGPEIELIQACIDRLTWKQSSAFQLMEIDGFSAEEAAVSMNCAAATARVHLMRAKQNLQKMLRRSGYEDL